MNFPNPPAEDGYYWIELSRESDMLIAWWRHARVPGGLPAGWSLGPWEGAFTDSCHAVTSERIVWQEPPAAAAPAAPAAPEPRKAGSAAPNTEIEQVVNAVMDHAIDQNIAAIAVAVVTGDDLIQFSAAANPHMASRLLAGTALVHDRVLRMVNTEAAARSA